MAAGSLVERMTRVERRRTKESSLEGAPCLVAVFGHGVSVDRCGGHYVPHFVEGGGSAANAQPRWESGHTMESEVPPLPGAATPTLPCRLHPPPGGKMRIRPLILPGACLLDAEPVVDERGSFTKLFDAATFPALGHCTHWEQECSSFNLSAGTVRGLHYQESPHEEIKLVRCVQGRIFDAIVDLRRDSPAFGRWEGVELCATTPTSLYVPAGFAHGYMTLEDDTVVHYLISARYFSELQRGIRWNDPTIGIGWPRTQAASLSPRDATLPFFKSSE